MAEEASDYQLYRGNCHCGAFVYQMRIPTLSSVTECNCTICAKKGYLWVFMQRGTFEVLQGSEDGLSVYTFGPHQRFHKFCHNCATPIMSTASDDPTALWINARAIQGIRSWDLKRSTHNGASKGNPHQTPAYSGQLPTITAEGSKLYTGGCHCGAVKVALSSKPLDETYEGAAECNCSICERNGYLWLYPKSADVILQDPSNAIGRYAFGNATEVKLFCKICGVNLGSTRNQLSEEQIARLPAKVRQMYQSPCGEHPLNARVLDGVCIRDLQTKKYDEVNEDQAIRGEYVNP